MSARAPRNQGFTLVEILIVVVILGILAAIVIPQFTSASETAKASSLISQLQTIRSQLELYQVQHNGDYPVTGIRATDGATDWDALTRASDVTGAFSVATNAFGPYLQQAAVNSFAVSATSRTVVAWGAGADGDGWEYNPTTGAIRAVLPATITTTEATALGLDTVNDVVVTAS